MNGIKRVLERLKLREEIMVVRDNDVGIGWGISKVIDVGLRRVL